MKFSEIIQKLGDLAAFNSLSLNPHDPQITTVAAVDEATRGSISYIEGARVGGMVSKTSASALILPQIPELQTQAQERGIVWIATPEPRLVFAKTISVFYQPWRPTPEIHPTAVIHHSAKIGHDVHIGAHVVIQEEVEIGNGVCIHPNVVIYPQATIGDRTTLHANCTIHERTRIGADCVIHSGAVIGAEGFGFVPSDRGWVKMEQSGYTVLEDAVEIGCNSAIDRPAVGETRIGSSTKVDNLVQVGHGCQVGAGCAIAGQTGLAGGVKLGKGVILAGQVGVANQAKIGDRVIASAQTGILSDVAAGEIVSGTPAIPHKIYLKAAVVMNHLPSMYQTLRRLQKKFRANEE